MNLKPTDIIEQVSRPTPTVRRRFSFLIYFMVLAIVVMTCRGFYLQIVKGAEFRDRAENNRVHAIIDSAPRGVIYDRNGIQLVENISSTDLLFDPVLLPDEEEEGYLLESLAELLPDVDVEKTYNALALTRKQQRPNLIAKALDHDDVLRLQEEEDRIRGTRLVSSLVRKYPRAHSIARMLGYTSTVSPKELAEDDELYPTDTTGKEGVEMTYDRTLRGVHGVSYTEVNASGREQTDLGSVSAVAGEDISLTIDVELQDFIYGLFSELDQKKRDEEDKKASGSAIVMNPNDGAVISLVNYPSYNPNIFSQPTMHSQSGSVLKDDQNPLFNRVLSGTYPSGSTIKPFLAAAALEEKIITSKTILQSTGGIAIGPWSFSDWKVGGHGPTDVKKALAESVNTFFYSITGGYEGFNGLGIQEATRYLKMFGWSEPTGIDLPSEAAGFLPSPAWKEKVKGESWYIGDTYHFGIGQGDVLVTPLQVAASTSIIANGGTPVVPYVAEKEKKKKRVSVSKRNLQTVREGMRQAVTNGSARNLSTITPAIAGKTGTSQIGGTEDTHAWFTSFAPYEDPEIVVTVLLERGGEGDKDAVPFAKEIWQWIIENDV